MIQLHPDYLIFQTSQGELIPCSAESVTIELIGEASALLDSETVRQAAAAVVHYFKHDLNQETVSVGEFSSALERVLNSFGYEVSATASEQSETCMTVADLEEIARASDDFELSFFKNLRDEFQRQAQAAPEVLSFRGLRPSVKSLVGAKRWCRKCETLSDQIVGFLRECLSFEDLPGGRALVVK
jgi:hypothetical protein